jgi:hypothetical protein
MTLVCLDQDGTPPLSHEFSTRSVRRAAIIAHRRTWNSLTSHPSNTWLMAARHCCNELNNNCGLVRLFLTSSSSWNTFGRSGYFPAWILPKPSPTSPRPRQRAYGSILEKILPSRSMLTATDLPSFIVALPPQIPRPSLCNPETLECPLA